MKKLVTKGKKVAERKKRVQVRLTARHISTARRNTAELSPLAYTEHCPIALAIGGILRRRVSVNGFSVLVEGKWYPLPRAAQRVAHAFDDGKRVQPMTFTVNLDGRKARI